MTESTDRRTRNGSRKVKDFVSERSKNLDGGFDSLASDDGPSSESPVDVVLDPCSLLELDDVVNEGRRRGCEVSGLGILEKAEIVQSSGVHDHGDEVGVEFEKPEISVDFSLGLEVEVKNPGSEFGGGKVGWDVDGIGDLDESCYQTKTFDDGEVERVLSRSGDPVNDRFEEVGVELDGRERIRFVLLS